MSSRRLGALPRPAIAAAIAIAALPAQQPRRGESPSICVLAKRDCHQSPPTP
jgi:hypothetical protein